MTIFAVLIVVLALTSGLQAVVVQINQSPSPSFSTFPYFVVNGEQQQLPGIQVIPETAPVIPELVVPEYVPPIQEENVVEPELRPLPVVENPCEACFSYMASLIEDLTDTVAIQPQIPEGPHQIDPETEIRPLPPVDQPETKPVVSISSFPYFPVVVPN